MASSPAFLEPFLSPPDFYRGTDFWMLNDKLEDGELIRQLQEMKKAGVYSVIARTYIGLKSDYPGPEFKKKMRLVVDTADALGMKIVLQAGYMPEAVLGLPEEFALTNLVPKKRGEPAPEGGELLGEEGDLALWAVNSKTFLDMFSAPAVDFYVKQSYEEMWRDFFADFGRGVFSIWVDEPSYHERLLPYPSCLEEVYRQTWGDELRPRVAELFLDVGDFKRTRYRYRRILADLFESSYFAKVKAWCESHGVWFSGHLMTEDTLRWQIRRSAATMPYYKYFDMPGLDYLTTQMHWKQDEVKNQNGDYTFQEQFFTTALQCTSAARQAGKEHILCEMYGVTSEDLNFRDQKHIFDFFAFSGVNHRSVHGFFYSLHGRGKRAYPSHVNYYQPYFKDYKKLTDTVWRTSYFISQGKPTEEILLLHPLETAFRSFAGEQSAHPRPASDREVDALDALFLQAEIALTSHRHSFDLGDEGTMALWGKVIREEGAPLLEVGKCRYKTVILPYITTLRPTTYRILAEFMAAGGEVILLGHRPSEMDATPASLSALDGAPLVPDTAALLSLLPEPPAYLAAEDTATVFLRRRREGEVDYCHLFNCDCAEGKNGVLRLGGHLNAIAYDPVTGTHRPLPTEFEGGATLITAPLTAGGNLLFTTRPASAAMPPRPVLERRIPLAPVFSVGKRNERNALLLEFCRYRLDDGALQDEIPVLALHEKLVKEDYRGALTQEFTVVCDVPLAGAHLAIEDAAEHRITVDGVDVPALVDGYHLAKSFETVPLPALGAGVHTLAVTRNFVPLSRYKSAITSLFEHQKGSELEPVYLVGDFAVRATKEATLTGARRYSRHFSLTNEGALSRGNLTDEGYPFYAGEIQLKTSVCLPAIPKKCKAYLTFNAVHACLVSATVNGKDAGFCAWDPYEIDVTEALGEGENEITLSLTNTLHNLIGPFHRPRGVLGAAWGGYVSPNLPWVGITEEDPLWYLHRTPDTAAWTDSYLLRPLGVSGVAVVLREEA